MTILVVYLSYLFYQLTRLFVYDQLLFQPICLFLSIFRISVLFIFIFRLFVFLVLVQVDRDLDLTLRIVTFLVSFLRSLRLKLRFRIDFVLLLVLNLFYFYFFRGSLREVFVRPADEIKCSIALFCRSSPYVGCKHRSFSPY